MAIISSEEKKIDEDASDGSYWLYSGLKEFPIMIVLVSMFMLETVFFDPTSRSV